MTDVRIVLDMGTGFFTAFCSRCRRQSGPLFDTANAASRWSCPNCAREALRVDPGEEVSR